jgi:hypothetical protein
MAPPLELLAAGPVILRALERIDALLVEQHKLAAGDAAYYSTYLAVAGEAVKGIEGEALGIIRQAAATDATDPKARELLLGRIEQYINGETLRPKLDEAIRRLREGRQALEEHAERLLLSGKTAARRAAALAKYDELLNRLAGYLGSLGNYRGPSAAALKEIQEVQSRLAAAPFDARGFDETIDRLLLDFDKNALIAATGECGRVVEALRVAFR